MYSDANYSQCKSKQQKARKIRELLLKLFGIIHFNLMNGFINELTLNRSISIGLSQCLK